MTSLLANAGETVHVIAHRWDGAPEVRHESVGGHLIVHRVALDQPTPDKWAIPQAHRASAGDATGDSSVPRGLLASSFPSQAFSWQAALLTEHLIETEGIDVIEAQEWEAPLYYFQLRRALNLGPARRPPCIVHLHSPSELIFEANGWDTTIADYLPAIALEEYSITTADAILCPSRFLAEQALARYAIDRSRVSVIPYPLGDAAHLERSADTWATGSLCHVGRLELRKGVLEWADAVALVAPGHPELEIEFVGGDTPLHATGGSTVGDAVRARVPQRVRRQFHFRGSRDRAGVMEVLSRSCASVVSSRWENFPYSCIESMCSGLPVIASPNGGMCELVADGVSGWIAADGTPAGLAGVLRRALNTPAADRARMGAAAEETVRRVCDNETILRRHLELKARLAGAQHQERGRSVAATPRSAGSIGLIVSCRADGLLDSCIAGVRAQTERPAAVCVVCDSPPPDTAVLAAEGWQIVSRDGRSIGDTERAAAQLLLSGDRSMIGVAFVDSRLHLEPAFLSVCRAAFAGDDRLGILSAWTQETAPRDRVRVQPSPSVPYIWHDEEVAPYVAVKTGAFEDALRLAGESGSSDARRQLFDGIMGSGWTALTYPAVLGSIALSRHDPAARPSVARYSSMAQAIQRLHTPLLQWLLTCPAEDRRAFVRQGFRNPARSARLLAGRALQGWWGRLQRPA